MSEVRAAVSTDTESVISLDHTAETDQRRIQFIRSSIAAGQCYIVESQGQIVGYGVLDYNFFGNGFIAMLLILPEFRRKSLGTQLMVYLESICSTVKLFTSTNQSNLPMQALLFNLGFIRSGIIENLDEGDPELVYFKRLDR